MGGEGGVREKLRSGLPSSAPLRLGSSPIHRPGRLFLRQHSAAGAFRHLVSPGVTGPPGSGTQTAGPGPAWRSPQWLFPGPAPIWGQEAAGGRGESGPRGRPGGGGRTGLTVSRGRAEYKHHGAVPRAGGAARSRAQGEVPGAGPPRGHLAPLRGQRRMAWGSKGRAWATRQTWRKRFVKAHEFVE